MSHSGEVRWYECTSTVRVILVIYHWLLHTEEVVLCGARVRVRVLVRAWDHLIRKARQYTRAQPL